MIILGVFLAMIGVADLMRTVNSGRLGQVAALVVAAFVAILGFWGTGRDFADLWLLVVGVLLVTAWVFADRIPQEGAQRLALVALAGAMLLILAFGQHVEQQTGWLTRWYPGLAIDNLDRVPFEKFVLATGVFLVLQSTANIVVRLVLRSAGPGVMESAQTLKGGRILGPLERTLLFAMCLGGHFGAVGAVVAAKGILRFPEISRADDDGDLAEYVLVGSFVSWLLALMFVPLF